MGMTDDLKQEVNQIIRTTWAERESQAVPEPEQVKLGNDAVNLTGTVLYADLAESTELVAGFRAWFAAEIYKCYLVCACRIIRANGGAITAFDGDRVMGVFVGNNKNTSAVRSALAIHHAVQEIITPLIHEHWKGQESVTKYQVRHGVGIDTSALFVARTGIRGSNDLVWVGRAANYAAKLCSLREKGYSLWITGDVFNSMDNSVKLAGDGTTSMWTSMTWTARNITVYGSNYRWGM